MKPPAECIITSISVPLFAKSSTPARMAETSEEKDLALGPLVPVLTRGIIEVGYACCWLRMVVTLEKTVGPSQNPGMKTRVGLGSRAFVSGEDDSIPRTAHVA